MSGSPLRVLFVGNYASARSQSSCAGIFVDRQANSLRQLGVTVETFDIGSSHSPLALLRSWFRLRQTIRAVRPDVLHAQYGTIVSIVTVLTNHPTVITFSGSDLLPGASISLMRTYA